MPDEPLTPPSALAAATLDQLIVELAKRAQCHGAESRDGAEVISSFGENAGKDTKSHRDKFTLTDEEREKSGCLVVVMIAPKDAANQRQCVCTMLGEGNMIRSAIELAADHYLASLEHHFGGETP